MRLDVYLSENGYAKSRTEAKNLIISGAVTIQGKNVTKPSYELSELVTDIKVDKSNFKYVSRGGLKLEAAITEFKISAVEKNCVDIGASSGGFTDCLLQNGASRVFAVDSGSMQLVDTLRKDARVSFKENFNARYMDTADFDTELQLAVMDVSFISATHIIPRVYDVLQKGADFVCLIKPQFEVGRDKIGKGGIVKNEKARIKALTDVIEFAKQTGFKFVAYIVSPIVGGDGNIEYLAHFKKP